jgi:hypothetical protein
VACSIACSADDGNAVTCNARLLIRVAAGTACRLFGAGDDLSPIAKMVDPFAVGRETRIKVKVGPARNDDLGRTELPAVARKDGEVAIADRPLRVSLAGKG